MLPKTSIGPEKYVLGRYDSDGDVTHMFALDGRHNAKAVIDGRSGMVVAEDLLSIATRQPGLAYIVLRR